MYNPLMGEAAGQGIETTVEVPEKTPEALRLL